MDIRELKRLRRKARRAIKDQHPTGTLHLMYKTYDGKLHVVGPSKASIDVSKSVEHFRRLWILREVKKLKELKAFCGL